MNDCKWNKYKSTLKTSKQSVSIKEGRKNTNRPPTKPHETEDEAIIRRFHDAQRMARFRARKKKALEEAKALETGNVAELSSVSELRKRNITFITVEPVVSVENIKPLQTDFSVQNSPMVVHPVCEQTKYSQLLRIIEELGKDIKLTYAGSRISAERIKIGIIKARMLIKECLMETEMNSQH